MWLGARAIALIALRNFSLPLFKGWAGPSIAVKSSWTLSVFYRRLGASPKAASRGYTASEEAKSSFSTYNSIFCSSHFLACKFASTPMQWVTVLWPWTTCKRATNCLEIPRTYQSLRRNEFSKEEQEPPGRCEAADLAAPPQSQR